MRSVFFHLLIVATLLAVAGCTSSPPASKEAQERAASFVPPAGLAGIYLFRPYNFVGSAAIWDVYMDAKPAGQVGNNCYLYLPVRSGSHFVSVGYGPGSGLRLTAEAGKNYYYVIFPTLAPPGMRPISEDEARVDVGKFVLSSLSGPEWEAAKYDAEMRGQAAPLATQRGAADK